MRYINLDDYTPLQDWIDRAKALSDKLATKTPEERAKFINDNSSIWTELKEDLLKKSHGKCWYTEAHDIASHYHVDHFRPKNKTVGLRKSDVIIKTLNNKEPYWWLAFDWENYRISASMPNTTKSCYFPLRINTPIAITKAEINNEFPALLDPRDRDDVSFLDFNEEGRVCPAMGIVTDTWEAQRVKISIRVYNLNHQILVDARVQIQNRCKTLINELIEIYKDIKYNSNPHARERYREKNQQIRKMVSEESELSATSMSYILKSEHTFIRKLVG